MANKATAAYYKDEDSIAMIENGIEVESRVRSRKTITNTSKAIFTTLAQTNS